MGLTLTKAAEWTSAHSGSGGKLVLTPVNQTILENIVSHLSSTSKNAEQAKLEFRKPLIWVTVSLSPSNLDKALTKISDNEFVSSEKTKNNDESLITLNKADGDTWQITVRTLESVEKVLNAAGDKKLAEVRACLEANRDPVANILGDRFCTVEGDDTSIFRMTEEIVKEGDNAPDTAEKKTILKMAIEFNNLDVKMMKETLSKLSTDLRLHPKLVTDEVHLLQQFAVMDGTDDRYPLEYLKLTGVYTYLHGNGCYAPPWRNLHGDIAYYLVKPVDSEEISVTASTGGWFINGGYNHEKAELGFERSGDLYKNLTSLLKSRSPKFTEMMDDQDFSMQLYMQKETEERRKNHQHHQNHQEGDGDNYQESSKYQNRKRHQDERQKEGKKVEKTTAPQPSLRWQYLNVDDESKDDEKKVAKNEKITVSKTIRKSSTAVTNEAFSDSSSESEEEEEIPARRQQDSHADLPSEYWQIGKLVKYLKGGNQTSTIISLCALRDFPLHTEVYQLAVRDVGGLEVLLNLLESDDVRCKIGSLKILKEISRNPQIRRAIADLGGLQTMVNILRDPNKDLKCLSAETMANVAKFKRARRTVRQHGGIKKLVGLLDCPYTNAAPHNPEANRDIDVARCGALALWSCSKSTKNKEAMKKAGVIPLLAKLLKSPHENMLIPVVGTLQECASEPSYRVAIRTEGMIEDLVKNLKSSNSELTMHCASTIFKCAEEKETRNLVRQFGGLDPLVQLLSNQENKELLAAATGALWKCAISHENVERFQKLNAIDKLVQLLNNQPEEVLVNVVGALGEMAKEGANRTAIRKAGGISPLVQLLTGTNRALLVNVTKAVGQCAYEPEAMQIIDKMDGVRLLWSLLKNPNPDVQSSAAWAICPCIENIKDAGEMVRSFVGGLELIVRLLESPNLEVLASVCAAIANIAKDEENLAVITDHGVVPLLAKLTHTTDEKLRRHLSEAIAWCCSWGRNRVEFGTLGAVAPLVNYLKSKDKAVHRSTARALCELSRHPDNCITMHEADVVKLLLGMVGSTDNVLQEAAAGCIGNIRRLALANEKARQAAAQEKEQQHLAIKSK